MRRLIILMAIILLFPVVHSGSDPLVLVGCFDGQRYPPMFCPNYTGEIAEISREAINAEHGDGIQVMEVGDWFFLLDSLNQPNVIGAVISAREGRYNLSDLKQEELIESFKEGLGLVGLHAVGHYTFTERVAEEVFPLNGTKIGTGVIHRNDVITSRHTHSKYTEHPVNEGSPDEMEIPDSGLVYHDPVPDQGWWLPDSGEVTVLYTATTVRGEDQLPSIIAYQHGSGRSVTFGGLRHIDAPGRYRRDPGWYNHSLAIPEVRNLIASSLVYVLEPFATEDALQDQRDETEQYLEEKLGDLESQIQRGQEAVRRRERQVLMLTVAIALGAVVAVAILAYFGFVKGS